jgi:hypothetical protein
LALLIPVPDGFFDPHLDAAQVNVNLHALISPHLTGDHGNKIGLCDWIVSCWGGIHGHDELGFAALVGEFGAFTVQDIASVAANHSYDRIASWTKIAAFSHSLIFPTFDAKNAAAMDCLSARQGGHRYLIPPTQVEWVNQVRPLLFQNGEQVDLYYNNYRADLAAGGEHSHCSLLEFEMRLFANSKLIASQWTHDNAVP